MPKTEGIEVLRAWRQKNETGRIHYIITTHAGDERRLWTSDATPLGEVLDACLKAQGYTGPKSGEVD